MFRPCFVHGLYSPVAGRLPSTALTSDDLDTQMAPVQFLLFVAAGSFHVKSSGDFHGPPPILLKFGTLVEIV